MLNAKQHTNIYIRLNNDIISSWILLMLLKFKNGSL